MQRQDKVSNSIYSSPALRSWIQLQAFLLSGGLGKATQTQKASRLESQGRKFQPTDTFGRNYETRQLGGRQQRQEAGKRTTQADYDQEIERSLKVACPEITTTETSLWSRVNWQQRHSQAARLKYWKKRVQHPGEDDLQ